MSRIESLCLFTDKADIHEESDRKCGNAFVSVSIPKYFSNYSIDTNKVKKTVI